MEIGKIYKKLNLIQNKKKTVKPVWAGSEMSWNCQCSYNYILYWAKCVNNGKKFVPFKYRL